jgi:hypothetical protein
MCTRPFVHFCLDANKNVIFLYELFPSFMGKRVQFHASFNENNIFFPQSVHDFNVVTGAIVVLIVW